MADMIKERTMVIILTRFISIVRLIISRLTLAILL